MAARRVPHQPPRLPPFLTQHPLHLLHRLYVEAHAATPVTAGANGPLPEGMTFRERWGRNNTSRGLYALDAHGYEMGRIAWYEPDGEIIFVATAEELAASGEIVTTAPIPVVVRQVEKLAAAAR